MLPLGLGAVILIWTYHGFDFRHVWEVMNGGVNYGWLLFSLVFGVTGHLFRGWRWNLALAPLGEYPRRANSVYAIFVSYAANLVLPASVKFRVVEFWLSMTEFPFPSLWERSLRNVSLIRSVSC